MIRRSKPLLVTHPAASDEIRDALTWYKSRDPRLAAQMRDLINHGTTMIQDAPGTWPRYMHGTQRYVLETYAYSIVYRVRGDVIDILAFAHAKRKPGYWRKRLRD